MNEYKNLSGSSSITGYKIDEDSVMVEFSGGSIYLYTVGSAGREKIEQMKLLATAGIGLSHYISSEASRAKPATTVYQDPKPSADPLIFVDIEREVLTYFSSHPEQLYTLPPRRFEELIASIFRQNGFSVELTPETRDGGIDIIAVQKSAITGGTLHLIECKRYSPQNLVGIGVVQRMLGVVEQHSATQGLIVTTSGFSRDAHLVAERAQHRLVLHDYNRIVEWLSYFSAPD